MPELFNASSATKSIEVLRTQAREQAQKLLENLGLKNVFGSMSVLPEKIKFETQDDDEVVILLLRAHVITNIWWIGVFCFLFFIPSFWAGFPLIAVLNEKVLVLVNLIWYVGLGYFAIENLLLWYYNVYIVTNQRIIDVDFFNILYKNVDVAKINRIEDVNYKQLGIFSSVFNYGEVIIQTASEQASNDISREASPFTFEKVPNPDLVVRVISELQQQDDEQTRLRRDR